MIKSLLSIVATVALCAAASAQVADVYPLVSSPTGSAVIPPNSTNVIWSYPTTNSIATNTYNVPAAANSAANTNLLIQPCGEFNSFGLTWAFTGTATSTNDLLIYPSYDKGLTFSAVPLWQATGIAPGAASFITNASVTCTDATTLALVVRNRGSTASTNNVLETVLKSPKYGAKQSTR
jgi:hypothetical protein